MKIIVANYRTGSTNLVYKLSEDGSKYMLPSGEFLHNKNKILKPATNIQIFKVMPDHWLYEERYKLFKQLYLEPASEIYYTLRKNINEQVDSFLYASLTKDWIQGPHKPQGHLKYMKLRPKDIYEYFGVKFNCKYNVHPVDDSDVSDDIRQEVLESCLKASQDIILKNLEWQGKVFKEIGGKLLWLEDWYENKLKYVKNVDVSTFNFPKSNIEIKQEAYFE